MKHLYRFTSETQVGGKVYQRGTCARFEAKPANAVLVYPPKPKRVKEKVSTGK